MTAESDDTPARFLIPEELIADWRRIPRDKGINLCLPRGAWDALFFAVQGAYAVTGRHAEVISAVTTGNSEDADEAAREMLSDAERGLEALRRWMAVVMNQSRHLAVPDSGGPDNG